MVAEADAFIVAWQGLEEALKNNDQAGAIQKANAAKAIATRHETLKRDISRKARDLMGPDREYLCAADVNWGSDLRFVEGEEDLQCFCRVHEALCNLQRQAIAYRMTVEPILKTRSGAMERLGKLNCGSETAVEHYAKNFPSRQPPQLARSVQEVLAKKPDDPFWSDILFETKDAAWAFDRTCQLGIKALQMRDRCLEEFRRLRTETARLIRRTIERQERIDKNLDLWIFALKLTEQSSEEGGSEDEGEEIGQNTGNGLQSTKSELREGHRALELRWMGDGLVGVWENQPDPSLWRDQCDDEVKNEMKDKWAEGEREVRQMLDILKNRNVEYSKMAKERGFVGGAINFSGIIEEIEGRSGAAGSFCRLRDLMFELKGETAGESLSNSRDDSESMEIDTVPESHGVGNEEEYGDDGLLVLEEDVEDVDEVQEAILHLAI
ncbi:hypothetical protein I315_05680 [Cryptococcus gattii Ru294]|nr:hypothetical protein I315_05680 [Cryptococcus gattii Ru294]